MQAGLAKRNDSVRLELSAAHKALWSVGCRGIARFHHGEFGPATFSGWMTLPELISGHFSTWMSCYRTCPPWSALAWDGSKLHAARCDVTLPDAADVRLGAPGRGTCRAIERLRFCLCFEVCFGAAILVLQKP